jgi:hypothetical protein
MLRDGRDRQDLRDKYCARVYVDRRPLRIRGTLPHKATSVVGGKPQGGRGHALRPPPRYVSASSAMLVRR